MGAEIEPAPDFLVRIGREAHGAKGVDQRLVAGDFHEEAGYSFLSGSAAHLLEQAVPHFISGLAGGSKSGDAPLVSALPAGPGLNVTEQTSPVAVNVNKVEARPEGYLRAKKIGQ